MRRVFIAAALVVAAMSVMAQAAVGPVKPGGPASPGATTLSLAPLWVGLEPALTLPVGDSSSSFTMGGGGAIVGEYRPSFFPLAFARAELGYAYTPVPAAISVSFTSASIGVGMSYNFIPPLGIKGYVDGGVTYGFFNNLLPGSPTYPGYFNPFVKAGADLYWTFPPGLTINAGAAFLYQIGLYTGIGFELGASYGIGTPIAVQKFEPRAPNLPEKAKPLVQKTGIEFSLVNVTDVYPVFYKFYDNHPIGSAYIHNWDKSAIKNVKLTVLVKEYMDDPKEVDGPDVIDAGKDASVDLFALFRKDVLGNTEDTKVSAAITLSYVENGKPVTTKTFQTLSILKRNALTWDDDRKAAAFVSPNDPTAVKFAKNVASIVNGKGNTSVQQNIRLAAAIHDALTLYGLTYTSDPVATLNSDSKTVDYIQFPQQTLEYRGGKCSDFSALYASMFEAVGLETAFITIPGHIFMAFALGLSQDDARASFAHRDDLIFKDNKVWMPIEITLREGGFVKAWQLGAKEWRENLVKDQAKLYPLHDAWKVYAPVGFANSASDIKIPSDTRIVKAFSDDLVAFVQGEMGDQERQLKATVAAATTQGAKSKAINSLAVIHSRFGLYDQAMSEFNQILAKDEYLPALINEGNIYFMQASYDKALALYNRAAAKAPNNATVLLCVARANHALENYSIAKAAYSKLQQVNPDLAGQFSYLDLRGDEATRAADVAGVRGTVVWSQ
jgi:tetratricopeptide (TPR) repeat protein